MYFYLRRTEERSIRTQQTLFSPTKGKIHGVWKFNNITPSHLSHPVDTGLVSAKLGAATKYVQLSMPYKYVLT